MYHRREAVTLTNREGYRYLACPMLSSNSIGLCRLLVPIGGCMNGRVGTRHAALRGNVVVIIITGASSGIGRAAPIQFSREGYLVSRQPATLGKHCDGVARS